MTTTIDFTKTLIRCSALGTIMTDGNGKTREKYMRQLYREKIYNRRKDITSKYLEKGLNVEEDSITLFSRFKQKMFKKNDERLSDSHFIGEPDFYDGENIQSATHIYDTKSSWDLFTFPFPDDKLDAGYIYQGQGYMALTGAQEATFAFCLVDTPENLIIKEIDSIRWRTGVEATTEQAEKIRRNMTFSDMPVNERVLEFNFKRDDALIALMQQRVELCRQYLISLHNQMQCRNQS